MLQAVRKNLIQLGRSPRRLLKDVSYVERVRSTVDHGVVTSEMLTMSEFRRALDHQ